MKNSLPHTDSKPLPWRVRPDLETTALEFDGRPAWGVKDPLSLAYFELSEESYYVLNQLDGQKSSEDVCRAFHERFLPRMLSIEDFRSFLEQLVAQNLVLAEGAGYGKTLFAKRIAMQRRQQWLTVSNLLAIRFRGFDPDRMLGYIVTKCAWLFSSFSVVLGLLLIFSAITLVLVHLDEFLARLPEARALLSASNLVWMSVLLATVKVLHEFGHGMTCKRFGGECHEMGLMLLVFTPTLYCNVSDIWMVKDKWRRIMVSLAGMWVELLIAAICTHLWWFSATGLFHSVCLNLMIVCSVNTFVFNGNPLLRYDGYFVLSDWLEIPNLQQQAMGTVRAKLSKWFCGFETGDGSDLASRWKGALLAYGMASSIYRVSLTVLILWGLDRWLRPYGLTALVQLFAAFTVGSMVLIPFANVVKYLQVPSIREKVQWSKFWWRSGCLVAGTILLINIPFPCRVTAGALADDGDAERVYASFAGTLIDSVRIGDFVDRGQIVARLDDPRLRAMLIQLEGELNQQRMHLEQLERRRISEPSIAQTIPTVRETVKNLEQQLSQRRQDAARLVVRAPRAGTVLNASPQRMSTKSGSLAGWTGTPLEERNRGSFLRAGTPLCLIGNDFCPAAVLLISQDDINLVRVGQRVRLLWNELSGEIQTGEIVEVAGFDLETLSREEVVKLSLPARITSKGRLQPIGKWYQARVSLEKTSAPLLHGVAGTAKISVDWQSAYQRMARWVAQTFPL